MAHVQAKAGEIVALDNGVLVTEHSSINVDVTLPIAAAKLASGDIIALDNDAPPPGINQAVLPLPEFAGAVTDVAFAEPPSLGTAAIGDGGASLYIKIGINPSVWHKAALA